MLTKLKENTIQSAGLSRIWKHIQDGNVGTMSAFRGEYTRKQNLQRHAKLLIDLRNLKYDYIQIIGYYPEAGKTEPSQEVSVFVFENDLNQKGLKKTLMRLGAKFGQDTITYKDKGSHSFELIATTAHESDGINYRPGDIVATFNSAQYGSLDTGLTDSEGKKMLQKIYSKIRGRPFFWKGISAKAYPEYNGSGAMHGALMFEALMLKASELNNTVSRKEIQDFIENYEPEIVEV